LDGFSELRDELQENGIDVVAASSDDQETAQGTAEKYGLKIGFGVDQATSDAVGGYWEPGRPHCQPSEFVLDPDGKIIRLSYCDGPIGRMQAPDVLGTIKFVKSKG
jgi:peroxiredoxin